MVRAWLGQLSGREREAVSSVVTLGTPHAPPPSGTPKQLDQTRGLLSDITSRFPGAYHKELRYLSVGSSKAEGKLWGGGGEGLLAYASYLALSGRGNEGGDGITPLGDALLDGSEHREVGCSSERLTVSVEDWEGRRGFRVGATKDGDGNMPRSKVGSEERYTQE